MDEDLIQKITQQVMKKLGNKTSSDKDVIVDPSQDHKLQSSNRSLSSYKTAIILLCGGNQELPEVFRQMTIISRQFSNVYVVMTRAATNIIGIPEARRASQGGKIITDYSQDYLEDTLFNADIIFVPVLTLNTAAKAAALNADTLATITMVYGLMYGKPVIVARDSIYCCKFDPKNIQKVMLQRIASMIKQLEEMGIHICDVHQLTDSISSSTPISTPTAESRKPVYSEGTAGKPSCFNGECDECGQCVTERTSTVQAMINGGAARIAAKPGIANNNFDRNLAKYIDHTLLKADATEDQIRKLCEEAAQFEFASVCVNPTNVSLSAEFLKGSPVKVCTVIGFPLGATTPTVKAMETRDALANGAQEVDMVINVGALKSGNDQLVKRDIEGVVNAAKSKALVKVILETALLAKEEIVKGCLLSKMAGANFVKTSTGFSSGGAKVEDIMLMRETVGSEMGVKASGGIRSTEDANKMILAGASRIGASASVKIVKGEVATTGSY